MTKNPISLLKSLRRFSVIDILTVVVIAVIVIVLGKTLLNQLGLKHEVAGAKVVANKLISDIPTQNGANAYSLGDANFKAGHNAAELKTLFKAAQSSTAGAVSVDKQIVSNNNAASNVTFIYKYSNKKPFYIRVIVSKLKHSSTWELFSISGGPSESDLLKN